jgi:hypothetical protein
MPAIDLGNVNRKRIWRFFLLAAVLRSSHLQVITGLEDILCEWLKLPWYVIVFGRSPQYGMGLIEQSACWLAQRKIGSSGIQPACLGEREFCSMVKPIASNLLFPPI